MKLLLKHKSNLLLHIENSSDPTTNLLKDLICRKREIVDDHLSS